MFFSQLLMLSDEFDIEMLLAIDRYFASLSPAARVLITISKLADATQISYQVSANILKRCVEIGLLQKSFGLQCPKCNMLLMQMDSLSALLKEAPYCSVCEDSVELNDINLSSDIIVLFSINKSITHFQIGRQIRPSASSAPGGTVAPTDSLGSGVQYKLVTYDDLFCISDDEYQHFETLLEQVLLPHHKTTEHGASLERLVCELLSKCVLFRATTGHKTQTKTPVPPSVTEAPTTKRYNSEYLYTLVCAI